MFTLYPKTPYTHAMTYSIYLERIWVDSHPSLKSWYVAIIMPAPMFSQISVTTPFCGNDGDLPTLKSVGNKWSTLIREMAKNNKLTRYSDDKSRVNRHGTYLLEMCKSVDMLIINGRLGRDKCIGDFIRVDTTGCSTVDYMICNPNLFRCIRDFAVESKLPESDHRGCSISLNCNVPFKVDTADTLVEWTSQRKYLWSIDDLKELKSIMIDFQSTLFL